MSQPYLKAWRGILEVISCCNAVVTSDKGRKEQAEACSTLLQGVEMYVGQIQELPGRQPKAVFNTLVYDLKLPAKVTESCISLLGKVDNIGLTLVDVLSTFLESAGTSGVMARQAGPGDDDPSGRVPTDLARAIGEQLEQAGLFKHLEPIFEQIQTQLTAAMPSVAVLQELAGEGPASRSHGSKGKEETMTVLQYTQQAILLYTDVQTLWPITSQQRGYGPSLEVTAVKLAVKFVQKVSSWLEQLPEDWREEPYEMFAVTMAQAIRAMTRCAMLRVADNDALQRVGPNRMVRYAPLMQSAVYHQALCIALFYNVHAQLMYTQRCADFAASKSQEAAAAAGAAAASSSSSKGHTKGSSTSSSSSKKKKKKPGSSSKGANAAAAAAATASPSKQLDSWGRACELAGGLPECELLLLRELGCSARAVLWAAAAASPVAVAEMPALNITALEMAYKQLIDSEAHVLRGMPLVLRQPGDHERAEQLHQLLPGLLLHLATGVPPEDQEGVQLWVVAANGVRSALQGVIQVQHQQRMGAGWGLSQAMWGAAPEPPPDIMPYKYMDLFLPSLQDALSRVLQDAWDQASSSRQPFGRDAYTSTLQEAAMRLVAVVMLLGESRVPWGYPAAFTWRERPHPDAEAAAAATSSSTSPGSTGISSSSGPSSGSSSSVRSQPHPWQPYASGLAALIESYARLASCTPLSANRGNLPPAMLVGLCSVGERPAPCCLAAAAAAAGFGSREQQQLFSLLCTLLKLGGALGPAEQTDAEEVRLAAALAAASFAKLYAAQAAAGSAAAAAGDASADSTSSSRGRGECEGKNHPAVATLLPWLVLFGRVCLQWAVQLQWRLQGIEGLPAAAGVVQEGVEQGTVMEKLGVQNTLDVFFTARADPRGDSLLICMLLTAVAAPLQDSRVQENLTSAGFEQGTLPLKLQATAAAATAAAAAEGADSSELQRELVQQVRQLGMALTSLPISEVCSNPFCLISRDAAAAGPSELNLVKGSGKACSGCRVARYESKTCQAKHWKQHKSVCKALAAAAAPKAAGVSAE